MSLYLEQAEAIERQRLELLTEEQHWRIFLRNLQECPLRESLTVACASYFPHSNCTSQSLFLQEPNVHVEVSYVCTRPMKYLVENVPSGRVILICTSLASDRSREDEAEWLLHHFSEEECEPMFAPHEFFYKEQHIRIWSVYDTWNVWKTKPPSWMLVLAPDVLQIASLALTSVLNNWTDDTLCPSCTLEELAVLRFGVLPSNSVDHEWDVLSSSSWVQQVCGLNTENHARCLLSTDTWSSMCGVKYKRVVWLLKLDQWDDRDIRSALFGSPIICNDILTFIPLFMEEIWTFLTDLYHFTKQVPRKDRTNLLSETFQRVESWFKELTIWKKQYKFIREMAMKDVTEATGIRFDADEDDVNISRNNLKLNAFWSPI